MKLAENRTTAYRIVIPSAPSEALRYAGSELARYLQRMTGAGFSVVEDSAAPAARELVLGATNREGTPDASDLTNDGYRLKTVGDRLFIVGENDRAVLYGVYLGLLEDELGCRFLSETVEVIPSRPDPDLPRVDKAVIPPLEYREAFWYPLEYCPDLAIKRGINSSYYFKMTARHGYDVHYWGFDHTLFNYVSPEEYFDTHPEYFSMVNGVRLREHTQLCLTNPEVLAITQRKLRQNILDHPECKYFSLSQMDWGNPCTCPECARVDEEEGAHSGTLLRFVNACAASVAEEFPDVVIDTFAYQYTRQAPKITRPLPNVCIRICSIECCFSHPLAECDDVLRSASGREHVLFRDDIADWAKICRRMFVWDYTTNYHHYLAPFPNFGVLQANVKFFLAHGVTGLFEQGNYQSESGEFGELRSYILSKLMWDPDADVEALMRDFLEGYYGKAVAPIREYIRLVADHMEKEHHHLAIFDDPQKYLTLDLMNEASRLWDEAESLAADEAELSRIRRSRLQVRYTTLWLLPVGSPERAVGVEDFIRDVQALGITRIRERYTMEQSFAELRTGDPNL